ncbi:GTP cyclohydrolase II [Pseudomonadales bacterium]|nr:GTP cyclohydrolase II [Pseudomonadales bacterium]MDA7785148.1 GTP cyclohydrolase II [Pseudomonadales bacterium]MDA8702507.1 GTP cyclohydrolase II [Pseudomonadales bacterium]MDA8952812.1 GTP cyclohydrolase II [Pseudomonadales bacterium]MDB2595974.1 GTP cyclohydrolase II [Pseudomonadales bacterium]
MARGGQHLFAHLVSPLAVNSVLVVGEPKENPLVRVHSNCLTGDVFGSQRCDCGPQLAESIARISEDPAGGYLVYMAGHEGRGIGLWAKAATYLLQDSGEDTYEANRSLGLPDDCRDFSDAAILLKHFVGQKPFRLLTNNPKKIEDLAAQGLNLVTREKHVTGVGQWNKRYLHAKQTWGHGLDDEDFQTGD